jgi:CheY-like chemotaxis protein
MNEPNIPNPNLEHTPQQSSTEPVVPNAQISQAVNPASTQQPMQQAQVVPSTPVQQSAQPPQESLPQQPIMPQQSGKKVLIVEDERFISELYTRALEKAGYIVSTISDGESALSMIESQDFDVILLDIMLPTMNGVDLLYKMKDPHAAKPLSAKVIITTNMDQKEETKDKVEQMADGYLIKAEVTPKELVSYVNQVLG